MNRWLCRIGGVDPDTLENCPATDRIWAAQLGVSLLLNFVLVFGLTYYSVGYFVPEAYARVIVALVIASVLLLFDRALFQFDWFTAAALREVRHLNMQHRSEIQSLLAFARPASRLILRLMISLAIAYTLSVFAELAAFDSAIRERLIADNYNQNQLYRDRVADFEKRLDDQRKELTQRIIVLQEEIIAAKKGVGSRADQDEYEALRTEVASVRARIGALEATIVDSEKRIRDLNDDIYAERYGLKDKPGRTGKPGCEPGSICNDLVLTVKDMRETNARLRGDIDKLEKRAQEAADSMVDLLRRRGVSDGGVIAARQREIETLQAESTRLEGEKGARLASYTADLVRDGTYRQVRDDPMIRIRVLNELLRDPVQGPGISQMSYLIKAFIAFLELAPVLAKIFFAPPTVYSSSIRAAVAAGQSRALRGMSSQINLPVPADVKLPRVKPVKVDGIGRRPDSDVRQLPEASPARLLRPPEAGSLPSRGQVAPEDLDKFAVPTLRWWIGGHPNRRQSAGDYYEARLAQGHVLFEADVSIITYCCRRFSRQTRFVELGFGFGELSLALALSGFPTAGFEADEGRFEGATAMVAALGQQGVDTSALSLIHGVYPEGLEAYIAASSGPLVFVSTNVTGDLVMSAFEDIMQSLKHFDHVIMDLSRFGEVRDLPSQRALVGKLRDLGYAEVASVYSSGDTNIRHFQNVARLKMANASEDAR